MNRLEKQEAMIKYNDGNKDCEVFFYTHNFMSGLQHAFAFIERNNQLFSMKLYVLNTFSFGDKWRYLGSYGKESNV